MESCKETMETWSKIPFFAKRVWEKKNTFEKHVKNAHASDPIECNEYGNYFLSGIKVKEHMNIY